MPILDVWIKQKPVFLFEVTIYNYVDIYKRKKITFSD